MMKYAFEPRGGERERGVCIYDSILPHLINAFTCGGRGRGREVCVYMTPYFCTRHEGGL